MRISLVLVACLILTGCGVRETASDRVTIVVSVPPQAWVVERLAGPDCDIVIMVPPGANPTTYEPTLTQMRALAQADLYIRVGHPNFAFESAWFDKITADRNAASVNSSEGLESTELDPHLWASPKRMRRIAENVAERLSAVRGLDAAAIADSLVSLRAEIDALDAATAAALAPYRGRRFFVFHAAWGYFARDYGLEQVAIEHGHMEPTAANLEAVIAQAREAKARSIFVQPQFSHQSAGLVADAVGAKLVTVDPLSRDWPASMHSMTDELVREFQP